jgi:hypothetical protein
MLKGAKISVEAENVLTGRDDCSNFGWWWQADNVCPQALFF